MDSKETNWQHLVKKHFGKRICKYAEELKWNIHSVDSGIKISYLVDCCVLETRSAQAFLKDILERGLIKQSLIIIEIEHCVFISSKDSLMTALDNLLKSPCILVDVSQEQKSPQLFSDFQCRDILHSVLQELSPQLMEGTSENINTVHLGDNINRSTVYGLLLGYPVVYWYSDILRAEHCLQMVPLNVVTVTASKEQSSHIIYSFSYPNSFEEIIRPAVDSWFEKIKTFVSEENIGRVDCAISTVLLPNIVL